ncbi:MAG: hypothetical protein ACE5GU_11645 [Candidatus Scalinduaceae bacterium]
MDIGIHFDINTGGFILDKNKLNERRYVIMEVSINSGISNLGFQNIGQNSEKTIIGFKNVGQKDSESELQDVEQKSEEESEFGAQDAGQKGGTINVFA